MTARTVNVDQLRIGKLYIFLHRASFRIQKTPGDFSFPGAEIRRCEEFMVLSVRLGSDKYTSSFVNVELITCNETPKMGWITVPRHGLDFVGGSLGRNLFQEVNDCESPGER